jgi:O-antigen/teichoic acid export membrane protein
VTSPRLRALLTRIGEVAGFNRTLLVNAGSLIGTSLITSLLGVGFWLVATHSFDRDAVGIAAAAVSAMTLLGFLATIGMGTLLMGELPRLQSDRHSLINAALATTSSVGVVLGLAFGLTVPLFTSNLEALSESWLSAVGFALGVGLTALAFVLDQSLIGLLRGGLQLWRNLVFAVVKLLLLIPVAVLVSDAGPVWIYSVWAAGIAASMVVLGRLYKKRAGDSLRPNFARLSELRRSAVTHHAFNLALRIPDLALPIVVILVLSATANASFFVAWMIVGFMFVVPLSLSTVLYAIGSADSDRLAERFRFTVRVSLAFGVLGNIVLVPAANPLLSIFGSDYAAGATTTLHILALGVFAETVRTHYVAIHRVERRIGTALPIVWGGTLLEVAGGAIGAELGGLSGVAWGWLAAICVEALVMSGDVIRVTRRGGYGVTERATTAAEPALAALDMNQIERL